MDFLKYIRKQFMNRAKISWHYFTSRKQYPYITPHELFQFLLSPSYPKIAQNYITRTQESDQYIQVYLKNLREPLFWPRQLTYRHLLISVVEVLHEAHWHYYQIPETCVQHNDIVIDCGAAEGLFGLSVLDKARHVYFIEPHPLFKSSLQKTFSNSNKTSILDYALADEPGKAFLTDSSTTSYVCEKGELSINIETIDRLFYNTNIRINYIKADIEGAELKMLKGSQNVIKTMRPTMAIATYHESQKPEEILSFVLSIVPEYKYKYKGIEENGNPVILHLWI